MRSVLWLPEDLTPKEERQQRFVDTLQQDAANQANTELLKTSLENLKTYVLRKLAETPKPQASDKPAGAASDCVLDPRPARRPGRRSAARLPDDLGYEVKPSYFDGDEKELREYHQESLVQCDGVIIYFGATNELWVQRKLFDLRKVFGLGRQRPFLAKAVFVGSPSKQEKERFRTQDAMVIKAPQGFSADALAPFLGRWRRIRERADGRRRPRRVQPVRRTAPVRGARAYLFFGRDGQSDELVGRLARNRFLAVVGVSGSGKSSLVRAGLFASLRGGFMAPAGRIGASRCCAPAMRPSRPLPGRSTVRFAIPSVRTMTTFRST